MKLLDILSEMNSFEKNSFLKILDGLINENTKKKAQIEKILSSKEELKNTDNDNIVKIFSLLQDDYLEHIKSQLGDITLQLDFVSNILIRDGNVIMKYEWFSQLYDKEIKKHQKDVKSLQIQLSDDAQDLDKFRKKDYNIYKACLKTAYENDLLNKQDPKITADEKSILQTLATELGLSQNELQLINYMIVKLEKRDLDELINDLKNAGIIFFSKKTKTVYVANEVVGLLRKIKNREVADKHLRRVLRLLKDPQVNLICKNHNIPIKNVSIEEKIKMIVDNGISFRKLLTVDIYKPDTNLNERKAKLNEIVQDGLKFDKPLKGATLDDKIGTLIEYFDEQNNSDSLSISQGGYEHLLIDLEEVFNSKKVNISDMLKKEFELQEERVLIAHLLLDYNIKPRDILEVLNDENLKEFCLKKNIKTRGNSILNILDAYKNNDDLAVENYTNIGMRDLNTLKANGVIVKEAELGIKFEEITKDIFIKLGLNVDEKLRKEISTNKDKMDIVINLENNEIIIVECKSIKESGYNKYSSVSRQIKSYVSVAENKGYKVVKSILVAPEFTNDFVKECELDFDINISLITAESLKNIFEAFISSKHKVFPYKLFRDILIKEERIIMAISK